MKRNNHLFVSDYGMQVSILSRYGIKKYAVEGRDFVFVNGDNTDLRYENIRVINRYTGVIKKIINGREIFISLIHIKGNIIIGKYKSEISAAIAYNKAVDMLKSKGIIKNYDINFITEISSIEYARLYNIIKISKKIRDYIV